MRFRYFVFVVFLMACILQVNRVFDTSKYLSLNHKFQFEKAPAKNTTLKMDDLQKYLIFYDKSSAVSKSLLENLENIFKFTKIDYDVVEINSIPDISEYSYFIFAADEYFGFKKIVFDAINEQIYTTGGTLFIFSNNQANPFNRVSGIKNIKGIKENQSGINFLEKIFPGIDAFSPSDEVLTANTLDVELDEDIVVVAETHDQQPIVWEKDFGEGRIIYSNSDFFESRLTRGVMNQIISYGSDWYINPILNSKLIHLDDFPSPIPKHENEVIKKGYGLDTKGFYNKIWWQDMVSLSARRNIKYSGFIIIDYNNKVYSEEMKENLPKVTLNDLNKRGRDLLVHGGELGIHGYNHNPLAFDGDTDFKSLGYIPWKNDSDILAGLKIVNKTVEDLYGKNVKLYSYVPPSNILTTRGKGNLVKAFPDLKTISSLFYGDDDKGAFMTEIGPDEHYPQIYTLPRFSSGFAYSEENLWNIFNAIALYGYMSHFVHPDDIISEDRGFGKEWAEILKEFENMILEVEKRFPFLEPNTNIELTKKYMNIEDMKIHSARDGDKIKIGIENFRDPFDAFVRIRDTSIKTLSSGEFKLISDYEHHRIYLIKFTSEDTIIDLNVQTGENDEK